MKFNPLGLTILLSLGLFSCKEKPSATGEGENAEKQAVNEPASPPQSKQAKELTPKEREVYVTRTMLTEYTRLSNGTEDERKKADLLKPQLIRAQQKLELRASNDKEILKLIEDLKLAK